MAKLVLILKFTLLSKKLIILATCPGQGFIIRPLRQEFKTFHFVSFFSYICFVIRTNK